MDWAVEQVSCTSRWTERRLLLQLRNCAVHLSKLIIHNNRTWFYEGEIHHDAQVVHGNVLQTNAVDFYYPSAFPFARVADRSIESCGNHNRKYGLSAYSSRNKQSHRCVSASFNRAVTISEQASLRCLKVKDQSFTQEIRAQ